MRRIRRQFLHVAAAFFALTATSQIACAQTKNPDAVHRVRVVVPCPAGSPTDISARFFFQGKNEEAGLYFYVENHAVEAVADTLTNGHTILFDLGDCDNALSMQ